MERDREECEAIRVGGTDMYCKRCGIRWSVDDDAPQCKSHNNDVSTKRTAAENARAFIRAFIRGDV